jgi:menaquinone-9 beta-reductase
MAGDAGVRRDVVVVGAGPAGTSVALQLARRGLSTTIVERARLPRTKVCGEYLSPSTLDALDRLGVLEVVEASAHPLRGLRIGGFGLDPVHMRLPDRGGLAISRERFDSLLADAAVAAGATLVHGTFVDAQRGAGEVGVQYRDGAGDVHQVAAGVLIGADGAWSVVAQRCGMAGGARPRGGRWAVGGHLATPSDGDEVVMYVGAQGYYARNPLGGGMTNAMLVMPRPVLENQADEVVSRLSDGACRFEPALLTRRVSVGPLRYRARSIIEGRVVLTGDAAELLDPFLGQGIAMAIGLSTHAADAAQALTAGAPSRVVAHRYATQRAAAVARVRRTSRAVDALLRTRWLRRRAARGIARRPELADELLAAIAGTMGGGLSPKLLWDLLA